MNSNIFSNLNISGFLPSMLNYPMNFLPSNWSNLPGLNQIAQSKVNKINFLNNQPQTSNLNSILQLLQQNGQNPSNL